MVRRHLGGQKLQRSVETVVIGAFVLSLRLRSTRLPRRLLLGGDAHHGSVWSILKDFSRNIFEDFQVKQNCIQNLSNDLQKKTTDFAQSFSWGP